MELENIIDVIIQKIIKVHYGINIVEDLNQKNMREKKMPYKNPEKAREYNRIYEKGYWAGFRRATILHLGEKCVECGSTEKIEIHHINGLLRKQRRWRDYANLEELKLKCKECHARGVWVK